MIDPPVRNGSERVGETDCSPRAIRRPDNPTLTRRLFTVDRGELGDINEVGRSPIFNVMDRAPKPTSNGTDRDPSNRRATVVQLIPTEQLLDAGTPAQRRDCLLSRLMTNQLTFPLELSAVKAVPSAQPSPALRLLDHDTR